MSVARLLTGGPEPTATPLIGRRWKLARVIHDMDVEERHPIMLHNLKEPTTSLNRVKFYIRIQAIHSRNQFTPVAHVRKAYLIGHAQGRQRGG
jgi:hypothetical protein